MNLNQYSLVKSFHFARQSVDYAVRISYYQIGVAAVITPYHVENVCNIGRSISDLVHSRDY